MSAPTAPGPYSFSLTPEEANVAASRIALRVALARRFEQDYVAPLVVFVLLLVFVAILAFTGLIGRRAAEAALLIGAIAFLGARFLAHWRLRRARRLGKGAVERIVARGEVQIEVDDDGLTLVYPHAGLGRRRPFEGLAEAEDAGDIIYLWRPDGAPIILPKRIFPGLDAAAQFLVFVRGRISAARRRGES
ncbi:MAG TPA: hypothetical protein VKS78_02355 [Roseiarcus sp.]|nr:hypothetical protein [Roseiarcus sp.]